MAEIPTEQRGARIVLRPTTYMETLMHFLRANIGTGLFATGDAIKNSGLILGPFLTAWMGFMCVYSEHQLCNASTKLKTVFGLPDAPDFATTAEMCFQSGPERLQKYSYCIRMMVNIFLCLTQLGFCCIHLVFVTSNIKQVLDQHGVDWSFNLLMVGTIIPIIFFCMIRDLKRLAPLSTLANVLIFIGLLLTMFYVLEDFKMHESVVYVAELNQIPLFFGTILYCFEGIGVVIPLKSEMINPDQFDSPFGVLNVGKVIVTFGYILIGVLAYLKYGDQVMGSFTLNIPLSDTLAQIVKVVTGVSILCTYPIQFYVAFQILWFPFVERYKPLSHPELSEISFRLAVVLVTFTLAEVIPYLSLFITLVGAFSSAVLALWIPPLCECALCWKLSTLTAWIIAKNLFIFTIGVIGAVTGSYESLLQIAEAFAQPPQLNASLRIQAFPRAASTWFHLHQ